MTSKCKAELISEKQLNKF